MAGSVFWVNRRFAQFPGRTTLDVSLGRQARVMTLSEPQRITSAQLIGSNKGWAVEDGSIALNQVIVLVDQVNTRVLQG